MLNFQQFQESFDTKPLRWKKTKDKRKGKMSSYEFSIDGNKYVVELEIPEFEENGAVDVNFGIASGTGVLDFGVTDTGNQFAVLVTVIDCIKDYIETHDPKSLEFSAYKDSSKSRGPLYKRLVKKYLPNGWKADVSETGEAYSFVLKKM